jgi:ketosteroid isomerase-like protein
MEPQMIASNLIRKYFSAYESKDRRALEELLSDEFTFTSPLDDHINRTTYFERCWPKQRENSRFSDREAF